MVYYRIILEGGKIFEFPINRQRQYDQATDQAPHSPWTQLAFCQCENCPLRPEYYRHCPAAVDVEQIATQFSQALSYEKAHVEVFTQERIYIKDCDIQTTLRALLGLVMATSGCPILAQFRGLAQYHLPFATMDETLFRTSGAYLLKQYYIWKSGGTPDLAMKGLEQFYCEVGTVNRCFKTRLDAAFDKVKDANLNAIGSLLYISMGVGFSIDDNMSELQDKFFPNLISQKPS